MASFFGGDVNSRGGIRVAVKNLDGDTKADLVVGSGSGAGSRVTGYLGRNIAADGTPTAQFDFDALAGFSGGVFVGSESPTVQAPVVKPVLLKPTVNADGTVTPAVLAAPAIAEDPAIGIVKKLRDGRYLTRDSRMKERKKYGLRGARRGTQFSKR